MNSLNFGQSNHFFDDAGKAPQKHRVDPLNHQQVEGHKFPLSYAQESLWFLNQYNNIAGSYNLIHQYKLEGPLDIIILEESIQEIIKRQPALRTVFNKEGEKIYKIIKSSQPFKISFTDLSQQDQHLQNENIASIGEEIGGHKFDLEKGPLIDVHILQLADQKYVMIINMHHIISDGTSLEVFKRELSIIYNGKINNQKTALPLVSPILQGKSELISTWNEQITYWKNKLADISGLFELPGSKLRPTNQTYNGKRIPFTISENHFVQLSEICKRLNVSGYVGFLTVFKILLSKYSGKNDILVGSPFAGKLRKDYPENIDYLVNTVALRTIFPEDIDFVKALKITAKTVKQALRNQDIPFEKIVEEINPDRNPSYHPVFQVMLAYQNYQKSPLKFDKLKITRDATNLINAKFDLTLRMEKYEGIMHCDIDYNIDIYEETFILQFIDHFNILLEKLVSAPELPIKNIPVISDEEYAVIIEEWNQTAAPFPKNKCLHHLFEEQVERSPDAVALSYGNQFLTYEVLNKKVNQLANYLIKSGVEFEEFVGIQVERSFEMVICALAVLKAGAAYVAIDPQYPAARKTFMFEDADIKFLLTTEDNTFEAKNNVSILNVNLDAAGIFDQKEDQNPGLEIKTHQLAYMIYTSGSTGQPKGVLIEHKGLPNLVLDHIRKYELKQGNCVLQFASLSFDASICEIGMALLSGATLCIAEKDEILPGPKLIRLLNEKKISHVTLPPSALSILPAATLPHLKVITVTGEACPEILIDKWAKGRKFFNGYGPSEATIGATICAMKQGSKKNSIGRPFANYKIYILDTHLQPVPVGIPGEIYIGGIGLARGYYKNEETTAKKFLPNPFSGGKDRIYKTGDIARYLPDGDIEFIGRSDNLVKLRGMRIELGEIESAINNIPGISQSKVILSELNHQQNLFAYYTTNGDHYLNPTIVKEKIITRLPRHMVPAQIIKIAKFPLSPNGKIDIRLLPEAEIIQREEKPGHKPKNPVEKALQKIWTEILRTNHIGIHDNFFDIGGHSLLAVALVTRIQEDLGTEIPVSVLMKTPTIAGLATIMHDKPKEVKKEGTLIKIRDGGHKHPIILFHTPSGHILSYYKLVEHLSQNHPVYGVQSNELTVNKKPYYNLKEMAKFYANQIRKLLPDQPCYLSGYCFGGMVAFEVANELENLGQPIAGVILIGSEFPSKNVPQIVAGESHFLKLPEELTAVNANQDFMKIFKEKAFLFKKNLPTKLWEIAFKFFKANNRKLPSWMVNYKLVHHLMIRHHIANTYPKDVMLIQPGNKSKLSHQQSIEAWRKIVKGQINDFTTDGNQSQMLLMPYAEKLGNLISQILDDIDDNPIHKIADIHGSGKNASI